MSQEEERKVLSTSALNCPRDRGNSISLLARTLLGASLMLPLVALTAGADPMDPVTVELPPEDQGAAFVPSTSMKSRILRLSGLQVGA